MQTLKNKYKDQTLNLVGSGPSLEYLKKDHFVGGPIIAINHATLSVEPFGFNDVYSMQKDGGNRRVSMHNTELNPNCDHSGDCGNTCGFIRRPKNAALLVHKHESLFCFPDYKPRFIFDWELLDLIGNECSMILAIQIGKLFGCSGFRFISFDAHTNGDNRKYIPGTELKIPKHGYYSQVPKTTRYIDGFDSEWITPNKERSK